MKKKLLIGLIGFLLINFSIAYSQTKEITGNIVAFKKYPIKNVLVSAKKSKDVVLTDINGDFKIRCAKNDIITFEAKGFQYQVFNAKKSPSTSINLLYKDDDNSYTSIVENEHLSEEILDYCVENLIIENNNFDKMNSIYELIQWVYPQAKFVTPDEGGNLQVLLESRGANSVFASRFALLAIDGIVVYDIATVRPNEIATIEVLIGNEAAHWGSRGGNGAVEITLKKGVL